MEVHMSIFIYFKQHGVNLDVASKGNIVQKLQ